MRASAAAAQGPRPCVAARKSLLRHDPRGHRGQKVLGQKGIERHRLPGLHVPR
jgi:hypothetical protein